MGKLVAVYDACVLYPAPLRDLLMELAITELFGARWTEQIHDEWIRNVLQNRPDLTRAQLDRTRQLMNENVLESTVIGYEHLIDAVALPDSTDRHVLAAAIWCNANVIVTYNLSDFPPAALDTYEIEAIHPDAFVLGQLVQAPDVVLEAIRSHRARLKNPRKTVEQYLETLEKQRLFETVSALRLYSDRF